MDNTAFCFKKSDTHKNLNVYSNTIKICLHQPMGHPDIYK